MEESKRNVVIIGNPGMGKSTIINSIFKRKVSASGLNIGTGLTKDLSRHYLNGITFIDTPGLKDIAMKAHAAKEIQKALDYKNHYKLLFVLTLEGIRIRPDDLDTIRIVMDAIKSNNKSFSIIINKLTRNERRFLENNFDQFKQEAKEAMKEFNYNTNNYLIIDSDPNLDDEDPNSFVKIDSSVMNNIFDHNNYFYIDSLDALEPDKAETIRKQIKEIEDAKARLKKAEADAQAAKDELARLKAEAERKAEEEAYRQRKLQEIRDGVPQPIVGNFDCWGPNQHVRGGMYYPPQNNNNCNIQ